MPPKRGFRVSTCARTKAHDVMDRLPGVLCVFHGFGELLHDDDGVPKVVRVGGQHLVLPLWSARPYLSGISSPYRLASCQSAQALAPQIPEVWFTFCAFKVGQARSLQPCPSRDRRGGKIDADVMYRAAAHDRSPRGRARPKRHIGRECQRRDAAETTLVAPTSSYDPCHMRTWRKRGTSRARVRQTRGDCSRFVINHMPIEGLSRLFAENK